MKSFLLCFYSYVNFLNGLGEAKAAVFFKLMKQCTQAHNRLKNVPSIMRTIMLRIGFICLKKQRGS